MAVVDPTGKVLVKSVMYPHQKNVNEKVPEERYQQAVRTFLELVNNYDVDIVAIGNGTASRETEAFVAENLKKLGRKVQYVIVNDPEHRYIPLPTWPAKNSRITKSKNVPPFRLRAVFRIRFRNLSKSNRNRSVSVNTNMTLPNRNWPIS
jgi:hypothetical protein